MKFSNGNWLDRAGFSIYSPAEVREVTLEESALTVSAPASRIWNRGMTLGGPLFTLNITSPLPGIMRVRFWHYKGIRQVGPEFELEEKGQWPLEVTETSEDITLKSGLLIARLSKGDRWSLDFLESTADSKLRSLTGSAPKAMAYITSDDGKTYVREQLTIGVGECIYGLGERFTPFVKNGQTVDIWNEDGGTSTEQSYKNIPFYVSSKGYGVFVNHPEHVSFEVGSEKVSKVQFSVPGECLDYYVIAGPTIKDVLNRYTSLTGKPSLPPAWSFGLWLTTSFTTSYDEITVNSFVDGMAERDLPLHVFHFDCFWMKEFNWCDFKWDETVFPDPPAMLKRLKGKGLKICVWINPYIAQRSYLFDEGMANGYLLKRLDGNVWQWDMWQPGMGIVDFTNPEACRWYTDKLMELVDMGVDCFKTDFGERIPTDVAWYDGSDPMKMHNYYSYLYNKVVYEALESKLGKDQAVLFARSATAGSQKFPVHWGGDCWATFDSMAESLRGGLSLGLSGFGFWSHDIGGFEHTATADVYKRWTAFGLLSSHSRLHGSHSYRVPWLFDEEAVDVMRKFTKLKCSLMPYLWMSAKEAVAAGTPVMRAMVLEFGEDPGTRHLDRQYMLGPSLLVAPVMDEEGYVSYYVPEGIWTDFFTGRTVEGGQWHKEQHGYMTLPLLVRPNSIIAVGSSDDKPDYDYAHGVTFHVYQLGEDSTVNTSLYNTDGSLIMTVTCTENQGTVEVTIDGDSRKPWSLVFHSDKLPHGMKKVTGEPGTNKLSVELA